MCKRQGLLGDVDYNIAHNISCIYRCDDGHEFEYTSNQTMRRVAGSFEVAIGVGFSRASILDATMIMGFSSKPAPKLCSSRTMT